MSTPSGSVNSPPSTSDEVIVPSATPGQRLRAQKWALIYSQQEGALVPMEAEVVHIGDPNTPYALVAVTPDGRMLTHPREETDLMVENWLKSHDPKYTDFTTGQTFNDESG